MSCNGHFSRDFQPYSLIRRPDAMFDTSDSELRKQEFACSRLD